MILKQGMKDLLGDESNIEDKREFLLSFISNKCNIKNINFLFGSGVSAGAIPTMREMAQEVDKEVDSYVEEKPYTMFNCDWLDFDSEEEHYQKVDEIYKKIKSEKKGNLEDMLGVLYSKINYEEGIGGNDYVAYQLSKIIEKVIYDKINVDVYSEKYKPTLDLYKSFYEKMARRGRELPRLNVFTTNNDLFSEAALDQLNIDFNNGFGGGLKKLFNPSRFSYSYSKSSDTTPGKYESLSNMVYLFKMHGSINWKESESSSHFLNIEEVNLSNSNSNEGAALVYPTPLKQNKSLGSPYADIMREFKGKLALSNTVLFVIGYSFSDEHVNNLIYHALSSNETLSVVLFGSYEGKPIYEVGDNRVFLIYGEDQGEKVHHFKYIVNDLLPDMNKDNSEDVLKEFSERLKQVFGGKQS